MGAGNPDTLSADLKRGQGNVCMFIEVENNPNFEGSYFVRFNELGPPRLLTQVKSYERQSRGEWCHVTGWCDDPDQPFALPMLRRWKIQGRDWPLLSLVEIGEFA